MLFLKTEVLLCRFSVWLPVWCNLLCWACRELETAPSKIEMLPIDSAAVWRDAAGTLLTRCWNVPSGNTLLDYSGTYQLRWPRRSCNAPLTDPVEIGLKTLCDPNVGQQEVQVKGFIILFSFNVQLGFTALDRKGVWLYSSGTSTSFACLDSSLLASLLEVWGKCQSLHIDLSLLLIGQTEEKTHRQSQEYSIYICTSVRLNWWIVAPEDWSQIPLIVKGRKP